VSLYITKFSQEGIDALGRIMPCAKRLMAAMDNPSLARRPQWMIDKERREEEQKIAEIEIPDHRVHVEEIRLVEDKVALVKEQAKGLIREK
jgi:hypothetical protein